MRDIRKSELSILALATVAAVALMYPYVGASHVEAAKRPELNPNDVELIISAKKTTLSVGEQPEITATLTNNSDRDLMLVRPLDGSDFGRFPQFVWT